MGISYVAEVPSNIAFLKYWGKSDVEKQWPANDSFSMTLSHLCTRTTVKVWHGGYDHIISFGGKVLSPDTLFSRRIRKHVDFLSKKFPGSSGEKLRIDTHNSFPEECGIASSASGFGALTLGVCAAWSRSETLEELEQKGFDASLLSAFARTGSGSACRSMFEGFVLWEKGPSVDKQRVTSLFSKDHWDLSDTVVLVETASKSVSSSEAHKRAWSSLFFLPRLAGLEEKKRRMIQAVKERNIKELGLLLEQEALEMHGVISTSENPICYMTKKTSQFLAWVRQVRLHHGLDLYFTLDAGPNIHLIYESIHKDKVEKLLKDEHPSLAYLTDRVGSGPKLFKMALCS